MGGQLLAAYRGLEAAAAKVPGWLSGGDLQQSDITVAVAWSFTQNTVPEIVAAADHPGLAALTARAEKLPAFRETFLEFKI